MKEEIVTFGGKLNDFCTVMKRLEYKYRNGFEHHSSKELLFFYRSYKDDDWKEACVEPLAWSVMPVLASDDKNYHAGIEAYQEFDKIIIEFRDGYSPSHNEIYGIARGRVIEFDPIGDSFWALVELIKQRLPATDPGKAEEPKPIEDEYQKSSDFPLMEYLIRKAPKRDSFQNEIWNRLPSNSSPDGPLSKAQWEQIAKYLDGLRALTAINSNITFTDYHEVNRLFKQLGYTPKEARKKLHERRE